MACWVLAAAAAAGIFFVFGWGLATLILVVFDFALVAALTLDTSENGSVGSRWAHQVREYGVPVLGGGRRAAGEHIYVNILDEDAGDPDLDPEWQLPVPLGRCAPLELEGTGLDQMFILRTSNPGEPLFYSVMLSVQGFATGIRSTYESERTSEAFGMFLIELAKLTSYVRGGQLIHRSVPADITPNVEWYRETVMMLASTKPHDPRLDITRQSYGDLIETIEPHVEEHRDFLVLKFYATNRFQNEAARIAKSKDAPFEGGVAQLVRDEAARVMSYMTDVAGMGKVALLGRRRTCAVIRSMMDPNWAVDHDGDAAWHTCFPSYVGDKDYVEIKSVADPLLQKSPRWYTRVGEIPATAIAPAPLGPDWLSKLLIGVNPDAGDDEVRPFPTIRTISVRFDLIPASKARVRAKRDHGQDLAQQQKEAKKGRVTDGATDEMASASKRRQMDLRPGSPHQGVTYGFWVSVTGRDPEDLDRAQTRLVEATSQSGINKINWQTDEHDVAQFATLPFGTGLLVEKDATSY
ncbi:hypothetical protein AXK57_21895 [Tsukamurella pulmonis]|uniref:hypothetical protein n=1 Tax=Tsukamurella pulmonis TaxID=47312 RepID=UPI000794584B|nr:hypothetical protein [Tsukamurella pulmonis]KXP11596.1 hypothetical protein AXK57_21895 [Tsukamurella pulmonis]